MGSDDRTGAARSGGRPVGPELPDPLVMLDGRRVASATDWPARRAELAELFQREMYGSIPPPYPVSAVSSSVDRAFLDGAATLKLHALSVGDGGPVIDLMTVVPNRRAGAAAVFLVMNFCGNQAVTTDRAVPLTRGWVPSASCSGCPDGSASEASRATHVDNWPLARLVDRGYAVATFCSSDVDSDRPDVSDGVYRWLARGDAARNEPGSRGTLAAWAWGFHRCVDHLITDPDIDATRIATVGHSRNGKAALLAAAFDERIAVAIANQAGCGGSAPSRLPPELSRPDESGRPTAETVRAINARFPHWFNARFKSFADDPGQLPFDQNGLVALCAPRPVLFTSAAEDLWANPTGQLDVLRAADGAYRLCGVDGIADVGLPPCGVLVGDRLGYHIRHGGHSMNADDWMTFADFADRHWT
jgi:hypothetical protein